MAEIPEQYAQALQLDSQGRSHGEIAQRLAIPAAAVPALLRIAEAKLKAVLAARNGSRVRSKRSKAGT